MDNKIKSNLVYLADNLTNLKRVLLYLQQNNIISLNESEEIGKEVTSFNQNVKLLNILQRKDFPINLFLEILRSTQNEHCADKIEGVSSKANRKLEKPKILRNLWWPEKRVLIESLYRRKIGDKLLIEELHEKISTDKKRMLVLCESVDASKLTGLGGVGKTLTATWYANDYANEYDHIIWIDSGEGGLLTSFQKLARDLDIKHLDKLVDLKDYCRKSYEVLEEFKCLWIFDNAESYKGHEGIKEVLPKGKDNFYCLITSRWREWGVANIGYGEISRLELNIFGESESLAFFKENIKKEVKYTEFQLKQLSKLLGNLPLAMQLAVAALNTGNIDLKNYIEKTPAKDLENIVDTKFDDYEKTINECVNITLELIGKEEGGSFAKEVLNIFGYIRPDNVGQDFLNSIFYSDADLTIWGMTKALQLLTKYSLINQVNIVVDEESESEDKFSEDEESESNDWELFTVLSIHRLLQQVIRHNCRETEKETLRKIIGCEGFLDYQLLPFTKYADQQLQNEYPKVKAELLDQSQLWRLVNEKKFEESVELAKFIHKELQKDSTKFNYAICLEMNGQLEDNIKVLEELYQQQIKEKADRYQDLHKKTNIKMGLLTLDVKVSKELVGGQLLVSHWKMNNKEGLREILEERKSFQMIRSEEMLTSLLGILNSNLIQTNYTLTYDIPSLIFQLLLDGDTKSIELKYDLVDLSFLLPNDLQELVLQGVRFIDRYPKNVDTNLVDVSDWLPKKLNKLVIDWCDSDRILLSLKSISSIENITLSRCSLSLDTVNRISPKNLKLEDVSFVKNAQELSNVKINEFIDLHKMERLELNCYSIKKKNLRIDLSKESANMEYLLDSVNVVSLKSSSNGNGRVNIKKITIVNCSLDLSILPSSLEKLFLSSDEEVFVSGGIDLPNLKYLELKHISHLPHFRSLQLFSLYLKEMEEVNVNILPPNAKVIRIDRRKLGTRLVGGVINMEKLILDGFLINELEEMLTHFKLKKLVLNSGYPYPYKPVDLIHLLKKQIPTIAIGGVDWGNEDFKECSISKQVDRKSEYYLFHEGNGKAIEENDFDELYFPYL